MARKGSRKVRTGCVTCKIRKVKCDEGKPFCNRCTSTGRGCDGYAAEPAATSTVRWQRPQTQTFEFEGSAHSDEARAIRFYREKVAPIIAGPTDPYFWTHLVVQFSNYEPAIKHSIIAIGRLYEDVQAGIDPHLDAGALKHYNDAIYELKRMHMQNQGLVLLNCLLFVCIEVLHSNREAAIRHCNHGLAILESSCSQSWIRDHLLPIFRRLIIMPLFFGSGQHEFPDLSFFRCPPQSSFETFSQAQSAIDDIFNQTADLLRHGDEYRIGAKRHDVPTPELLQQQADILKSLDQWQCNFQDLDARARSKSQSARITITGAPRVFALMRYEVCRIWTDMALAPDEMGYDRYLDNFRAIVEEASTLAESQAADAPTPPHFIFESGFNPLLFFIATKCRALDTRIQALRLMWTLGSPREMMWNRERLYSLSRRMVEIEHGITVDDSGQIQSTDPEPCMDLPPDERRIRHSVPNGGVPWHYSAFKSVENTTMEMHVGFFMRTAEDELYLRPDVIPVASCDEPFDFVDGAYEFYSSSPGSIGSFVSSGTSGS